MENFQLISYESLRIHLYVPINRNETVSTLAIPFMRAFLKWMLMHFCFHLNLTKIYSKAYVRWEKKSLAIQPTLIWPYSQISANKMTLEIPVSNVTNALICFLEQGVNHHMVLFVSQNKIEQFEEFFSFE